jgi:UDP-2,3-diacylglucosamine hydrolase
LPGIGASAQNTGEKSPVAIICGGGAFPRAVAESVLRQGRPVHLFLLRGFADPGLQCHPHEWVKLGSLAAYVSARKQHGLKDIVFIGSLIRPKLSQIGLDWRSLILLPRIGRLYLGGDNKLLTGVAAIFEENGFRLRGAHEVAPDILMPEGVLTRKQPSADEIEDIQFGFDLVGAMGPFDVGQAVVIAGRRVLSVEAAEGTSLMLARVAEMRRTGRLNVAKGRGVLVKAPKPGQDLRIDLPAIGTNTIAEVSAAGLSGIAVVAGASIVADGDAFTAAADDAGLFVIALPAPARAQT